MLSEWAAIEADFDIYLRADLSTPEVLDERTWRWFTVRLFGLPLDGAFWRAMRRRLGRTPTRTAATTKDDVEALRRG